MKVTTLQRTTYRIELTEAEVSILKALTQNAVCDDESVEISAFRAAICETLPTEVKPR